MEPRRIAIIQSSYIPWRGYFSIVARCDAFVFLDSVQFTRRDWRTRNRIKTPAGPLWLSIPVRQKGQYHAAIDAIEIAEPGWADKHLRGIATNYRRAPFFTAVFPLLEAAFGKAAEQPFLSAVNRSLTASLCGLLGIRTPLSCDTDLIDRARLDALDPTERLVELAAASGATEYLSGPSARSYLDESAFAARNMSVGWMDYSGLLPYRQLWGEFDPALSIVDALLNLGPVGTRAVLGD
ncbi:MAG: WbqC family protein [Rhodospirillales bacterium]